MFVLTCADIGKVSDSLYQLELFSFSYLIWLALYFLLPLSLVMEQAPVKAHLVGAHQKQEIHGPGDIEGHLGHVSPAYTYLNGSTHTT